MLKLIRGKGERYQNDYISIEYRKRYTDGRPNKPGWATAKDLKTDIILFGKEETEQVYVFHRQDIKVLFDKFLPALLMNDDYYKSEWPTHGKSGDVLYYTDVLSLPARDMATLIADNALVQPVVGGHFWSNDSQSLAHHQQLVENYRRLRTAGASHEESQDMAGALGKMETVDVDGDEAIRLGKELGFIRLTSGEMEEAA